MHVESSKLIRGGRVVRVVNTLVWGTEEQLEEVRSRCEDSKKLNTSFIERLNLILRRHLACLHRRTNSAVRARDRLAGLIDLLQCYYNFVLPHGRLKRRCEERIPAQQAGLVSRRLSFRDIFLAFRPWARRPWIVDEYIRRTWNEGTRCVVNNT